MITNSDENINHQLEALPLWAWAISYKQPPVRLTEWSVNDRLEVVKVVCGVRS